MSHYNHRYSEEEEQEQEQEQEQEEQEQEQEQEQEEQEQEEEEEEEVKENANYPSIDMNQNDLDESKDQIDKVIEIDSNQSNTTSNNDSSIESGNLESPLTSEGSSSPEKVCLSQLGSESNDIFLFELPLIPNEVPKVSKQNFEIENSPQVKLPFDETRRCIYIEKGEPKFKDQRKSYWELIEEKLIALSDSVDSMKDIEKAIKSYNFNLGNCNFDILHKLSSDDRKLMPKIINLALQLPTIMPRSIPLLCQKQNKTLFLSQYQISCLLANAFLCTFHQTPELCPNINFNNLFKRSGYKNDSSIKLEKLKCIMNYFRRVLTETPKGVVSFERRFLEEKQFPKWGKSNKQLSKLKILDKGTIETDGIDMLQVDFANKLVGGGVLNRGAVQEEIRFCINPELIVSRLFTQQLLDEEVLIMKGAEQYSTYEGYGNNFEWDEDYKDTTPFDTLRRRDTTIVAMDAIKFASEKKFVQYDIKNLNRELNKAYCGFIEKSHPKKQIASGNWGCGAFNGDKILKALIQLMAASECERDLNYFTFGDSSLKKELDKLYSLISERNFLVRDLYKALQSYDKKVIKNSKSYKKDLIEFIRSSASIP